MNIEHRRTATQSHIQKYIYPYYAYGSLLKQNAIFYYVTLN